MPKFKAYGQVVGSKYLGEVEADTEEEAKRKAWSLAHVSLCHQCSDECEDPEVEEIAVEAAEPAEQS